MKTITTDTLVTVTGGVAGNNSAVTQQLTALQGSIKDLATSQAKPAGGLSDPSTMMMMMMAMRPQQQTVVAAPAAASPVINISNRVRRW
ncbi:MAG: hypothetical protein JWP01_2676 [Myxococcales bacterium]|nr:hypothetical protein [Myxococcales bacterium]